MLLKRLTERLETIRYAGLPPAVVERVRACVLDALACAYGGIQMPWSQAAAVLSREIGGIGPSTVWLNGESRTVLDAVFANSAASHAIVQEDMHAESASHPGTVVIPVALALAEHLEASGPVLTEAVVAGYEAMGQIGRLATTPAFFERGFRPSGVFGPFGAAAAGARLLGLQGNALLNALALSGNMSAELCEWAYAGSMETSFENATAARNGLQAAFLAAKGVEGPASLLEGQLGFLSAYSGAVPDDADQWPQTEAYEIENVYFKPYASCAFTQESIEAAKRLVRFERLHASDVHRVTVRSYAKAKYYPGCDYRGPFYSPAQCQTSNRFAVAAVLLDGDLTLERYLQYSQPEVAEMTSRITIEVDPEAERLYPGVKRSTVIVELADGRVISERVDDLAYPTHGDIRAKFERYAQPVLGVDAAMAIGDQVGRLEHLARVQELTNLLRPVLSDVETPVGYSGPLFGDESWRREEARSGARSSGTRY